MRSTSRIRLFVCWRVSAAPRIQFVDRDDGIVMPAPVAMHEDAGGGLVYTYTAQQAIEFSSDSAAHAPRPVKIWGPGGQLIDRPSQLETSATGRLLVLILSQIPRMESTLFAMARCLSRFAFEVRARRLPGSTSVEQRS